MSKQEIRASFTNIVRFFYCKEDGSEILLNVSMWYFLTNYYRYSMFAIFIHSDVRFCLRTHPTKGENAYVRQRRKNGPNIISIHCYLLIFILFSNPKYQLKEISFIFVKSLLKPNEEFHIPIFEYR